MYSTLDVEIRPGSGLGLFEIGSSLWNVLDLIRTQQHALPQVDIQFDPDASTTTPIILHVRPHLDLLFSGLHQRLHTICVRKLRDPNPPITLRYKETVLSSNEEHLTRMGVNRAFGPTYPGDDLRYPGLWFSFEDDGIGEGLKGPNAPEDRTQEVKRVLIGQKGDERDTLDEVEECATMAGEVARAVVKVHEGVSFSFYPSPYAVIDVKIGKTTAQDLVAELGPPLRVYYREDDRMNIHATRRVTELEPDSSYFYNYFQHGVDFLISGTNHTVAKIILHSNIPGSPLFQRYKRCLWEIQGKPEDDEDDNPAAMRFYERFETINHFLGAKDSPPSMVLDRTDDDAGVTLPSASTRLYGYDGIILEVTESSQVASVTLF